METGLIPFIVNTLLPLMNDPENAQFFLPGLLLGMTSGGQPVLPLTASEWSLGTIGGDPGNLMAQGFASGWYNSITLPPEGQGEHHGIPCPSSPYPTVSVSGVTVTALENLMAEPSPAITATGSGYQLVVQLTQGLYTGVAGVTSGPVSLACGGYSITQCVCTAAVSDADPTACDGYAGPAQLTGTGTLNATIGTPGSPTPADDVTVTVTAQVGVAPGGGLAVTVSGVQASVPMNTAASPPLPQAALNVTDLTVNDTSSFNAGLDESLAEGVLNTAQALGGILDNLNAALNQPANLAAVQAQLNIALGNGLDSVLGPVPATGLVSDPLPAELNPVDAYLFQRIHTSLATPGTDYYLPAVILFFQDPTLEPYSAGDISFPDQTYDGIGFSGIALTGVSVAGTSNAVLPPGSMSLSGGAVTASVALSTLQPGPTLTSTGPGQPQTLTVPGPPLTLSAGFTFTPGTSPNPVTGTATVTVSASQVQAVFTATGSDLSALALTFTGLTVSAQPGDVAIGVELPGASGFASIAQALLNTPDSISAVLQALNQQLAGQLGAISQTATTNVQTLAAARLGG